ncbi:MAG: Clp protease ClpP [Clostridiales bacterium]|nr:Clp protease ClpP [Clostridiales bacterium]
MKKFWNWIKNEDTGQRELWLEGVIAEESWWGDEVTPAIFKEELLAGNGAIVLHINSPGGDCIAASQIYTMLMDYPADVIVQIDGVAASAASVIAMAGTTVRMSPTALMMVHNPWTTAMGDADDMQKAIDLLSEVKESIINAYQIKTGLSRVKLSNIMDAETWLNAHKAKELGFCDEVLYEASGEDTEEPGAKPDFIFSAKTAALVLMNKVMESIPKVPADPEHPPDPAEPSEAKPQPEDPVTVTHDNRVKASDLEKRLALLK